MNKRFSQIGAALLCSAFMCTGSGIFAQNPEKEARQEVKTEEKNEKLMEWNDRYIAKKESKLIKEFIKDRKLDNPATARGSKVLFYQNGESVVIGYFDEANRFHSYSEQTASSPTDKMSSNVIPLNNWRRK